MFAVIFEVQPKKELWREYLGLAKLLRPELERIDGFIGNERFASLHTEGRLLSLSLWDNEKALIRWRTHALHHEVQEKGRFHVFQDYHLRVGEIADDSDLSAGRSLVGSRFDETATGRAKAVTISETLTQRAGIEDPAAALAHVGVPTAGEGGVVDREFYESVSMAGKSLMLVSWSSPALAATWLDQVTIGDGFGIPVLRHRAVRVIRDYGMFDRREAPQFYPSVERSRTDDAA